MSVSQSTPLPKVKQDYKIGTYIVVNNTVLMHINYITNDFILLEDCSTNEVESWDMSSFLKAKKRIVSVNKQNRKEVTV